MSFTSDSWKKSGGINRTSRHNLVRTPFAINNTLRISDTIGTDPSVNTIFDSSIIVNGDASFNGTSDFNGTVDFNEDVIFNGSITNNGPTRIVIDISQTEYLTINSNTGILPTDVISSLLLQNDSQRPSMLAYNITNTTTLDTITTNNLIFSISGDTVSVGEGFGDSTFNVFGDANISDICSNVFISNVTQSLGSRGEENVAIGVDAFINSNDNCRDNTAIGTGAMYRCTIGNGNVCLGRHALYNTDKGDLNTAIGKGSLGEAGLNYNVLDFSYNTAIGYRSGYNMLKNATNGSAQFNTFLGPQADVFDSSQSYSYSTAIGANAKIDASNQIVLGTSNENVVIPGKLGVGITNPSYPIDMSGTLYINSQNTAQGISGGTPCIKIKTNSRFSEVGIPIVSGTSWKLLTVENNTNLTGSGGDLPTPTFEQVGVNLINYHSGGGSSTGQFGYENRVQTGIGFSVRDKLILYENALAINNIGNVGIGTIFPSEKLDVSGNAIVHGNATFSDSVIISDVGSNVFISDIAQDNGSRGEENVAIGVDAFIGSTDNCRDNISIGTGAMYRCTIGNGNVCLGRHALYNTDKGDLNTAIGKGSLGEAGLNYNVLDFSYNTAIGYRSGI